MILFYPTTNDAIYYIEQSLMKPIGNAREVDQAHVFSFNTDDPVMFLANCRCLADSNLSDLPSLSLITEPESLYPFLAIELDFMKTGKLSTEYSSLLDHRHLLAGEVTTSRGPVKLVAISIWQNYLSLHYSNTDILRLTVPPTRASLYSLDFCFKIPEHRNPTAGGSYPRVTPEITIKIEAANTGSACSYKIYDQDDDIAKSKHIMTVKWCSRNDSSMQVDMRYGLEEVNLEMLSHTFPRWFGAENEGLFFDGDHCLFYHR